MSNKKYTFGKRLKFFRKAAGLRQCDLAVASDLRPSAICNFEQEIRMPRMDSLIKLSKALDISIDELVGR